MSRERSCSYSVTLYIMAYAQTRGRCPAVCQICGSSFFGSSVKSSAECFAPLFHVLFTDTAIRTHQNTMALAYAKATFVPCCRADTAVINKACGTACLRGCSHVFPGDVQQSLSSIVTGMLGERVAASVGYE